MIVIAMQIVLKKLEDTIAFAKMVLKGMERSVMILMSVREMIIFAKVIFALIGLAVTNVYR